MWTLSGLSPFWFVQRDGMAKTSQGGFHVPKCTLDASAVIVVSGMIDHHVVELLEESLEEWFGSSVCFDRQD